MKKEMIVFAALACLVGCATTGSPPATDADVAAIKEVWVKYTAVAERNDASSWLALWDGKGLQMPPGMPARDLAQLAPAVTATMKQRVDSGTQLKMAINPDEVNVAGPWGYVRGTATQDFTDKATGQTKHLVGKYLTIFKRQQDGSWRIYRDCFNWDTP